MSNRTTNNSQNLQIKALHGQGYNPEQIASGLGLNEDAVKLVIAGFEVGNKEYTSLKDRFGDIEELAMEALKEVCIESENHGAKVMAAKILLERKEALNSKIDFDYDEIASRLEKARSVSSEEPLDKTKILRMENN